MPPLLFGASREPVLNGIGSQRNREMLSADNIHPRQAPCCQLTTTSSRGAVIWQEFRPSDVAMLEWLAARISADLPSGRGSVRLLYCLLSKGAAGLRRLALLNSIRTVRREVDSPLDRVITMSHVMAPSLTPAMPRPCVRMRRTKRISSLAMDVASADCPKPGQVTAITIEPGEASSLLLGRARPRWRTESRSPIRSRSRTGWHPGPAVGGARERGAAAESPRCKRRLSSVVNL